MTSADEIGRSHAGAGDHRGSNGGPLPLARLHLPDEHDRSARRFDTGRLYQRRPAGWHADYWSPPRRSAGASRFGKFREGKAMEKPVAADAQEVGALNGDTGSGGTNSTGTVEPAGGEKPLSVPGLSLSCVMLRVILVRGSK